MKFEGIAALVTSIAALSSLIVFLINRRDRKRDPLPKQVAEVALAQQSLGVIAESRDALKEDVERLSAEVAKALDRIATLERRDADSQTEIAGLKRRLSAVIDDRDELVRYVLTLRQWVANGARPPAPVLPVHLRDVLPDWVPDDGAEPPHQADPVGP